MKRLINNSGRRLLIPLQHPEFLNKKWGWQRQVVRTTELHPRTGAVGLIEKRRGFPGTLTLLADAIINNLPDSIASVPEVKNLIRRGLIRLEQYVEQVVKPATPPKESIQAPRLPNGKRKKEDTQ